MYKYIHYQCEFLTPVIRKLWRVLTRVQRFASTVVPSASPFTNKLSLLTAEYLNKLVQQKISSFYVKIHDNVWHRLFSLKNFVLKVFNSNLFFKLFFVILKIQPFAVLSNIRVCTVCKKIALYKGLKIACIVCEHSTCVFIAKAYLCSNQ